MTLMRATSEKGYFDKKIQDMSWGSDSIADESIQSSDKEMGKTVQESETTQTDKLPSWPEVKSEGKKTFEKNITSD